MKNKLKIAVLFGGKSSEHEVSIETAKFAIDALDRSKYIVISIKIPKNGKFDFNILKKFDVVFPVLHGAFGEDGTIQGMLKLIGVPFIGASVLGSAIGLDKDIMKRLLKQAGIPIANFITCKKQDLVSFEEAKKVLGLPMFVKPANTGSSVGVSKVENKKDFEKAIALSFKYDIKIIIEEMINGREIECGVIGNDLPKVSVFGEIICRDGYYTYEAKCSDGLAEYVIPAKLNQSILIKAQQIAVRVYKTLECEGMGRVDFFLKKNGDLVVNEINTIPGPVMFRKLWEASGMSYQKLLDKLINLAILRFKNENKLKNIK